MESSASSVDAVVRPWRTATFVAGAVAVFELVALVAIGIVFLGPSLLDWMQSDPRGGATKAAVVKARAEGQAPSVARPPKAKADRQHAKALLPRSQTSVLVLNGNGVAGAAAAEAERVHARRYVIAAVGNAPRTDYDRSLVMYRPGHRGEATRLARDLAVRLVTPLDGLRRSQLMGAHVAVIIGAE